MVDHHVCFPILTSNHRKDRLNMEMKHILKYGESIESICVMCYPAIPIYWDLKSKDIPVLCHTPSINIDHQTFGLWRYDSMDGFEGNPQESIHVDSMNISWIYHGISNIPWYPMNIPMCSRFVHYLCWLHQLHPHFPHESAGPRHSQDDQTKAWLRIPQVPAEAANQRVAAWAGKGVEHWKRLEMLRCWVDIHWIELKWFSWLFSDALLEVLDFNKQIRPFFIHCNKCGVTSRDVAQPRRCKNHRPVDRGQWSQTK